MAIDHYTKFILTMLMVGVWVLAASIFFQPTPLQAFEEDANINIESVGGASVYGALPVEIEGVVRIEFDDEPVIVIED